MSTKKVNYDEYNRWKSPASNSLTQFQVILRQRIYNTVYATVPCLFNQYFIHNESNK